MKLLFSSIVGSRLYGFSTPESDTDYKGFALPEIDELLGLKNWEQNLFKDTEKKEEGTIFALKKFVNLSLHGNPTILEVNFTGTEFTRETTELGELIRMFLRKEALTKQAYFAYKAYFYSQVRKLERPEREGKRQLLIDEYGYDVKFASHAWRLARQCKEILTTGTFNPTMRGDDLEFCKEIRAGKPKLDSLLSTLKHEGEELENYFNWSDLPDKPDFNKCNNWLTQIQLKYVRGEYENGAYGN